MEKCLPLDEEQVDKCFVALDAANNNEIQYSEFLSAMVSSRIALHDDLLRTAFQRFDKDGSGFISFANLKAVLGGHVSDDDIQDMMGEVNTTIVGQISYKEFIEYLCGTECEDYSLEIQE